MSLNPLRPWRAGLPGALKLSRASCGGLWVEAQPVEALARGLWVEAHPLDGLARAGAGPGDAGMGIGLARQNRGQLNGGPPAFPALWDMRT